MTKRQTRTDLTAEFVRSIMVYDSERGVLIWRRRDDVPAWWNTRYAGKIAGHVHVSEDDGYVHVVINSVLYLAHRIIWLYVTGAWPLTDIDHRDTNRANNRFENFRLADGNKNAANRSLCRNNKLKLKGVHWHRAAEKYQAQIGVNNKRINLGFSDCPAAAHLLYVIASDKHFGEFARTR